MPTMLRAAFFFTAAAIAACGTDQLDPIQGTETSGAGGSSSGAGGASSSATSTSSESSASGSTSASTGSGGGAVACKRGIASNATPSSAFAPSPSMPGVAWWYDWSTTPT